MRRATTRRECLRHNEAMMSNRRRCRRDNGTEALNARFCKEVLIMLYRHTQRGVLIVSVCLAAAALDAFLIWRSGQWMPAGILLFVPAAAAIVFSSLTVEVNANELSWRFGPGLWTYRVPLQDIETVAVVRNHWWNGFGIRRGAGFRLSKVSGLDADERPRKPHDARRIGTDDPQGLAKALQAMPR